MNTGGPDDLFTHCLVTWMHKPRGGYGFVMPIPAKVESWNLRVVTIEIVSATTGKTLRRNVAPASLRWGSP